MYPFTFLNCLYFSISFMSSINIVQFCLPINLGDFLGCMVHTLSADAAELEYQPHSCLESQVKHSFMIRLGHHIEEWLFIPCQVLCPPKIPLEPNFVYSTKVLAPAMTHQTALYTPLEWIYSKTCNKKLVTHLESHMLRARWVCSRAENSPV